MSRLLRLRPTTGILFLVLVGTIAAVGYSFVHETPAAGTKDVATATSTTVPAVAGTSSAPEGRIAPKVSEVRPVTPKLALPPRDPSDRSEAKSSPQAKAVTSIPQKTKPKENKSEPVISVQNVPSNQAVDLPQSTQVPQDPIVQSHAGYLPKYDLDYEVGATQSDRAQVSLSTAEFRFTTTGGPDGSLKISLSSPSAPAEGEVVVSITHNSAGQPIGYTVERGGQKVTVSPDPQTFATTTEAAKTLFSGSALMALREKIGQIEASPAPTMQTDLKEYVLTTSALINYSVIAAAQGDTEFLIRNENRLIRTRTAGQAGIGLVHASLPMQYSCQTSSGARVMLTYFQSGRSREEPFKDCVNSYEGFLLRSDYLLRDCLNAANSRATALRRAAERFACHMEFLARSQSGIWQFIGCSAVPWK